MSSPSLALEKGLPSNVDAERLILGSVLLDDQVFIDVAGQLKADDFCLDKHRRIYRRMTDLFERGERIDRITLANELMKFNELESVDGLTYLVSLDDGLPRLPDLNGYLKIIRDKSTLRRIVETANTLMHRALLAEEDPQHILAGAEEQLLKLGESQLNTGLLNPQEIIQNYQGGINAFLDPSKRIKGISTELMSGRGRFENRNQEVSALSRGMKLLAKELNCPMLVLSQLSRAPETRQGDHRPQLSDLRESGSIEQDADLVGFIFREEVYKRDREDLRGLAELIVAKQRNGPIGKIDLVYLHAMTKFENRAEDLAEPA